MQRMTLVILGELTNVSQLFLLSYGLDKDPGSTLIFEEESLAAERKYCRPAYVLWRILQYDGNDNNCHLLRIYYLPRTSIHASRVSTSSEENWEAGVITILWITNLKLRESINLVQSYTWNKEQK